MANIDLIRVIVRFPGLAPAEPDLLCRAIIGHSEYRPESRRRTKAGDRQTHYWHLVKWIDFPPEIYRHDLRKIKSKFLDFHGK